MIKMLPNKFKKIQNTFHLNFKLKILNYPGRRPGMYLPVILLASVLFMAFATAIISIALSNVKMANLHNKKITSMSISEAGINYYMWHLAHDNTDYCDGNATCNGTATHGPYTHQYKDEAGNIMGTYDLYITPPSLSDASVVVKSIGKVAGKSPAKTIVSKIGMPSFAQYTLLLNGDQLHLGSGGKIEGTVHVNNNTVWNEGEITGDASSTEQNGVYGSGTFGGTKLFPVPAIDFARVNVDALKLRDDARGGKGDYFNSSGKNGYHIVLKPSSYDIYKVSNSDSKSYVISSESIITSNHAYPAEGIIVCEDNVWVSGTIDKNKVTIVAADPEANSNQYKNIYIPGSIKFTNMDGRDKIGLISQKNVFLAASVPEPTVIDAAMIALNDGAIGIDTRTSGNNYYFNVVRNNLTLYGSMAAKTVLWKVTSGANTVAGFKARTMTMDKQNVLNPPPHFPLTGTYAILSWREE